MQLVCWTGSKHCLPAQTQERKCCTSNATYMQWCMCRGNLINCTCESVHSWWFGWIMATVIKRTRYTEEWSAVMGCWHVTQRRQHRFGCDEVCVLSLHHRGAWKESAVQTAPCRSAGRWRWWSQLASWAAHLVSGGPSLPWRRGESGWCWRPDQEWIECITVVGAV